MPIIGKRRATRQVIPDHTGPISAGELAAVIGVDATRGRAFVGSGLGIGGTIRARRSDCLASRSRDPGGGVAGGTAKRRDPIGINRRYQHELCADARKRASTFRRDGLADGMENPTRRCDLMTLSPRRFPDKVARLRETPADRNAAGEHVAGAIIETELRAVGSTDRADRR